MSTTPRQVGQYQLLQQLGRGSVGEVWKGYDLQLRREVAVKLIHPDLQADPHFFNNFTQQGQALTALQHPHIVPVRTVNVARISGENAITAYLAMDYIEGSTFTSYLNATSHRGIFPSVEQIVYLFTSLGIAIDYAHERNVVHGNIQPNNILLDNKNRSHFTAGEPMLTDFGLTKLSAGAGALASPHYMSPEQARGEPANNRSDIYALGVLLYEICTGIQPFRDGSSVAVMMQHMQTLPTPPSLINPNIPPMLSEVILRAMAKDTATRYAMGSLLAAAIAEACSLPANLPGLLKTNQQESGVQQRLTGPQTSILGVSQPIQIPQSEGSRPMPALPRAQGSITSKQPSLKYPVVPAQPTTPARQTTAAQEAVGAGSGETATGRIPVSPPRTPSPGALSGKYPVLPSPVAREGTEQEEYASSSKIPVPSQPNRTQGLETREQRTQGTQGRIPVVPPPPSPAPLSFPGLLQQRFKAKDTPVYIIVASLLLLLVVIGCGMGAHLLGITANSQKASGEVFFQDDAVSRNSTLSLNLKSISAPPSGKAYFAWLQDTNNRIRLLGMLSVSNGNGTLLYQGDEQHTNLLTSVKDIFITLENADNRPITPGQERLYRAAFDATTFSSVKDLLSPDANFPGAANVVSGMLENIQSMNDKAGSVVDSLQNTNDLGLARRQAIRIIELLDGTDYAKKSGDLPGKYNSLLGIKTGLLSSLEQKGYLDTLSSQLDELEKAAGNNQRILQRVQHVRYAITNLRDWLQKIRLLTVQILKTENLKDSTVISAALQLKQIAADAYTGRTIPPNSGPLPIPGSAGASQAYVECQYMAMLELKAV